MLDQLYIEKQKKIGKDEDYNFLRKAGLGHIQNLARDIWTDHNVHDPGVNILEVLCFAITDLAYRTRYPIEDIWAEKSAWENDDYKSLNSAREVMTCNPVTINDFRKAIIDVPGVKNAWLDIVKTTKPEIYVDCKKSMLSFEDGKDFFPLHLRGLYRVKIELEQDPEMGDLNKYYFPVEVIEGETTSKFELKLPAWNQYFSRSKTAPKIKTVRFLRLKATKNVRKYTVSALVTFEDGKSVTLPASLLLLKKKSFAGNIGKLQASLNKDKEMQTAYANKIKRSHTIVQDVYAKLHKCRNLCEDFVAFEPIEVEEIGICADIEIGPESEVDTVLAQIYKEITDFLTPSVNFYSIKELLDKGKDIDEIFEGPVLNHGFIDDKELISSNFRKVIHVSDIINIVMDIDGVVAVKSIMITNFFDGEAKTTGEKWCLNIEDGHAPELSISRSKISLYKGVIPYPADKEEVVEKYNDLLRLDRYNRLEMDTYDLEPPKGKHRDIQAYHSIQNHFPLVYGIGQVGLLPSSTELRKAQAKQLKAYLLLYDQLFADYLAQLAHIKDLFSIDPDIKRTYFTRSVFDIPKSYKITDSVLRSLKKESVEAAVIDTLAPLKSEQRKPEAAFLTDLENTIGTARLNAREGKLKTLILENAEIEGVSKLEVPNGASLWKEFIASSNLEQCPDHNIDEYASYKSCWDDFLEERSETALDTVNTFNELVESKKTYHDRKNRFLDHLMARFCEQFTDYVLLMHAVNKKMPSGQQLKSKDELIKDKLAFLKDYPRLSYERGKAFDYTDTKNMWDTTNVSGLEGRVSRLLGINNFRRRNLLDHNAPVDEKNTSYDSEGFHLVEHILLRPKQEPEQINIKNVFSIYRSMTPSSGTRYTFLMKDALGRTLLKSVKQYATLPAILSDIQKVIEFSITTANYKVKQTTGATPRYYVDLTEGGSKILCRHAQSYPAAPQANAAINRISAFSKSVHNSLKLVPLAGVEKMFKVCVKEDCSDCLGFIDPYSFRITLVIPYWPTRFQSTYFRKLIESTIRMETPAHIHAKICWVDRKSMKHFEKKYRLWLKENAKENPEVTRLMKYHNDLVESLHLMRSVYPEGKLYDCEEGSEENPILLDNTIIGTIK